MNKEEIINGFLNSGYLLSPDFFDTVSTDFNHGKFLSVISNKIISKEKPIILNKDLYHILIENPSKLDLNWMEFEKSKALMEKGKNGKVYNTFLDILSYEISEEKKKKLNLILKEIEEPTEKIIIEKPKLGEPTTLILNSFKEESAKISVNDFVAYFKIRYDALRKILQGRPELQNTISINRLTNKQGREPISIIGLVYDKNITKNGNILLTIEDPTGHMKVLVNKNREDLFNLAKDISVDEVIGVNGVNGNNIIFSNNLFYPDILASNGNKKSEDEVYVAFISDLHVGSNMFLGKEFAKFIKWINGNTGNLAHKRLAQKVKYLFIIGDLIDGVGVYPDQEKELVIKDIYQQYNACAELLSQIRKDIKIIICPGNHDALRLSIPQPPLDKDFAKSLWDLPNVVMISNPALINIHSSENFSGFNVLVYHGYGFHYYIDNVDSLRLNNARDNPNLIVKYLLQRRHLAPAHSSTLYIPKTTQDPLVIDKVPDILACGELHRTDVSNYNGVLIINCSCWQAKTDFQEKTGNNPDPAKVPLLNLKTRVTKVLNFGE